MIDVASEQDMQHFGQRIGTALIGGEFIELIGDVGAGKTTFTKGLALGLAISDPIQSPTFTISRIYSGRDGINLAHYDFYRLQDAGIMADELQEVVYDKSTVTVVEWGGVVDPVLPADRLTMTIVATGVDSRRITLSAGGAKSQRLLDEVEV